MSVSPRTLLLIPSVLKREARRGATDDSHPRMDYFALSEALNATILDYSALEVQASPTIVRLARRAGRDAALAALGYAHRGDYDIIFSNSESVGIPLAMLLKRHRARPTHVVIGHRLSTAKKRLLLQACNRQMDAIFVYASTHKLTRDNEV